MKTALLSVKFWLALLASLIFGVGVSIKAAGTPVLTITSPMLNQDISGNNVQISLSVGNFTLTDYTTHTRKVSGQGHVHLWLDQNNPNKQAAVKIFSESYVFENVKPGTHKLVAELVNNDHSSLVPPVTTEVMFKTGVSQNSNSNSMSPFMVAVGAFLFIMVVLYFVSMQTKSSSNSGKQSRKSSPNSSKRSSRK